MSQKNIPQSIFGDRSNAKPRQTPGGSSSIVFGTDFPKPDDSTRVKTQNRQASSIFGENVEPTKKVCLTQHEDTKTRVFGTEDSSAKKSEMPCKSFNPITGENAPEFCTDEEDGKKDATTERVPASAATVASVAVPTRVKQPPGGKSTKLW